jgi:hypothetical protein
LEDAEKIGPLVGLVKPVRVMRSFAHIIHNVSISRCGAAKWFAGDEGKAQDSAY